MAANLTNVPANQIVQYVVRVPGESYWSLHTSEKAAHQECARANRTCRPGHKVFAEHKDGSVTGPYSALK